MAVAAYSLDSVGEITSRTSTGSSGVPNQGTYPSVKFCICENRKMVAHTLLSWDGQRCQKKSSVLLE
ncbi:hypothetical protein PHISCL_05690 [Aspergillus sclerotialis]|uniref:Uncharacterized protein n=1 Tax=Aspergillus sclerotialis TaxID=2070753 RepID=A0A3A2ZG61_9EURO|nr:hypothetical protein PHISCL_05690 [Aspergillus sclerotialis]